MKIIYDPASLDRYLQTNGQEMSRYPILIDHYLEDAIEVDVDADCRWT